MKRVDICIWNVVRWYGTGRRRVNKILTSPTSRSGWQLAEYDEMSMR